MFESGATMHGSNDLVLTAQNDAAEYEALLETARAFIRGEATAADFKKGVSRLANKQDNVRYLQKEVSEAAGLLQAWALETALEQAAEGVDMSKSLAVYATARTWFDSHYGNTYHSVKALLPGGLEVVIGIRYGKAYRTTLGEWLNKHFERVEFQVHFLDVTEVHRKKQLHQSELV